MNEYKRVNNDKLKSKNKCLKVTKEYMELGKAIVIDNTNPDISSREPYIKIAKEYGYKVIAFDIKIEKDLCMKMDFLRKINQNRDHLSKKVGSIPIHVFYKKYQEPILEEGFDEIYKVHPKFNPINEAERKFLNLYF